jgi:phospholipid/cholesterol/gamma-HCH transport system permease protein
MTQAEASATEMARAELRVEGDTLVAVLAGDWSIEQQLPRFDALVEDAGRAGQRISRSVSTVAFDSSELGDWDSSLLIFLLDAQDYCEKNKIELDGAGLPRQVPRLLALARAVPERVQTSEPERLTWPARLGTLVINGLIDTKAAITFAGDVAIALAGLPTRRVHMRWREFWVVVQQNSSGALPIVTLIALLVGVIIAFLGVVVLKRFGAGYYVSYLVGFGMLREMGALMTGIIIAGRTGAGFAAELGSMKITEEIDAFTTLGISPIEHLVLPRLLGLFVMMPLLTLYSYVVGIGGGMLVSAALLDLSVTQFMNGLLSAVNLSDALLGVGKGVIFGGIVGVAGCMKGLQGGSDAGAVGRAATSAVVLGITLIIVANAVIDWLAALLDI